MQCGGVISNGEGGAGTGRWGMAGRQVTPVNNGVMSAGNGTGRQVTAGKGVCVAGGVVGWQARVKGK